MHCFVHTLLSMTLIGFLRFYFILLTESKSTMNKKFNSCIILMGCSISTYM